jgi:hypothetical protein
MLAAFVAPIALLACSSSSSTAGTGAGGGSSATTGTGGATTSSTTGSTTATTGSTSASTGTGTGGAPPMGACTNVMDGTILAGENVKMIVQNCALTNQGQEPATKNCIQNGGNPDAGASMLLSDACTKCFDDNVQCIFAKCLAQCAAAPSSQACTDCRATNCDPAFAACSGLPAN